MEWAGSEMGEVFNSEAFFFFVLNMEMKNEEDIRKGVRWFPLKTHSPSGWFARTSLIQIYGASSRLIVDHHPLDCHCHS